MSHAMHRVSNNLRREMINEHPYCEMCGELNTELLVVDHIVPISKGGTNDRSNLQILCGLCNDQKGEK